MLLHILMGHGKKEAAAAKKITIKGLDFFN
jgi:hypothetical protein